MSTLLKYRRHRFHALHALLTGVTQPPRKDVPQSLRRDVGLPDTLDTRAPRLFHPALGAPGHRDG